MAARGSTAAAAVLSLVFALYVGLSEPWHCPDTVLLVANLSRNGTLVAEGGFNTTFPFFVAINGTVNESYPWINASRLWLELNFTSQQRGPLAEVLATHPNASFAAVFYDCNITRLNCSVRCELGGPDDGGDPLNATELCTRGSNLTTLYNASDWFTGRWDKLCQQFVTMQVRGTSLAWLRNVTNETVLCEFNTSIPIKYNITLYGDGLTRKDETCTLNSNRTVECLITNGTRGLPHLPNCTIHRMPWPVWINARFDHSDVEDFSYYYDEMGDYFYYRDGDGDGDEDEDDDEDDGSDGSDGGGNGPGQGPGGNETGQAKHTGEPGDSGGSGSGPVVVLVVGLVAVVLVAVFGLLHRRRTRARAEAVRAMYRQRSVPDY